ncbi:oxidoreductase [Parendozoicomonas haliclonae]|uniref:Fatty acyl-CoA reductase n=1 Tax=Parendozoicomonas haliclonae TaxID=1960125 RepID=A0A1X7AME8_9GAMM|nr:oxidoreductase [Parendozoicomonas haliclonae]SMA49072.1 Fatty acyl-CoA reductase [Parendozoicomonas haliclonae]
MKWNSDHIGNQSGKRFLITGANSGIGLEAAKVLAGKGAEVILAVRDLEKGQRAQRLIDSVVPGAETRLIQLDLSDSASVASCVQQLKDWALPIDVLINNAGVMNFGDRQESVEGYELMWATNHLGHFALTAGILPLLEQAHSPRVVYLSSLVAKMKQADIYYQDLNFEKSFDGMAAYSQSKLANSMIAAELQERLKKAGSKVIALAAHPGYTATNLQRTMGVTGIIMNALLAQKPVMGALPTLMAATDESLVGGEYIGPMRMNNWRGYPGRNSLPKAAEDSLQRKRLWETTEKILGLLFLSPA